MLSPDPRAEAAHAVLPFFRTDGELHEPTAAAHAEGCLPLSVLRKKRLQMLRRADGDVVHRQDQIAGLHAALLRGRDGALVLRKPHDQHALGKELHTDRLADRHEQLRLSAQVRRTHSSRRHEQGGECKDQCRAGGSAMPPAPFPSPFIHPITSPVQKEIVSF